MSSYFPLFSLTFFFCLLFFSAIYSVLNYDNFSALSTFIFYPETYPHSSLIDRLIYSHLWSTDLSAFIFDRQTYLQSSLIHRLIYSHLWSRDLSAFIFDRQTYLQSSLIHRLIYSHLWSTDLSAFICNQQTYLQSSLIDRLILSHLWSADKDLTGHATLLECYLKLRSVFYNFEKENQKSCIWFVFIMEFTIKQTFLQMFRWDLRRL